jgi:toxin YoeB
VTRRNPTEAARQRLAIFTSAFCEDLRYWVETDRKTALRVLDLVDAVLRDPFKGIGKPEPLKYWDEAAWSRRVNEADRLVYIVDEGRATFLQCRYHY